MAHANRDVSVDLPRERHAVGSHVPQFRDEVRYCCPDGKVAGCSLDPHQQSKW